MSATVQHQKKVSPYMTQPFHHAQGLIGAKTVQLMPLPSTEDDSKTRAPCGSYYHMQGLVEKEDFPIVGLIRLPKVHGIELYVLHDAKRKGVAKEINVSKEPNCVVVVWHKATHETQKPCTKRAIQGHHYQSRQVGIVLGMSHQVEPLLGQAIFQLLDSIFKTCWMWKRFWIPSRL